jgi:hypothetical protein
MNYNEMFRDKLKPTIRPKRRGHISKTVVISHDNSRWRIATHTAESVCQQKFEVSKYPPHNPSPTPSKHHLFRALKKF